MDQDFLAKVEALALNASLGEMFRDFQLLLNSMQKQHQPPPITQILSAFQPKSDLHKLFRVKLVDQFKCVEALEEMLRGEDSLYSSMILPRCSWYFENVTNVQTLVNNQLPCMSFITRTKVINAYARHLKDSRQAEEMFLALRERYGLAKAVMILPACNETFVRDLLRHIHVQLPARVVLALYDKYPSLVIEFVTFLLDPSTEYNRAFRNFDINCYDGVFLKMAAQETKTFMSLYEKYHANVPYLSLGRKVVRKLIKTNVTSIIEKFSIYSRILKKNVVVNYLSLDQIKQLQLSIFPKTMTEFFKSQPRDTFLAITSNLKPEIAQKILLENFETAFGRKLSVDEFADVIKYRMIAFLPVQERSKWVEAALTSEGNVRKQAEYISELEVAQSFPRLQKLAQNQSDFNTRSAVLKCLVKSVRKEKDLTSFAEIVGHIVERYRNDNVQIRSDLFEELNDFKRLWLEMPEPGWSVLVDLVNQVRLNGEVNRFVYYIGNILSYRIQGCFIKGQDVESHLNFFCDVVLKGNKNYDFDLCKDTPYYRQCLEWFCQTFQGMSQSWIMPSKEAAIKLFVRINDHNALSKDKIAIPNWLTQIIEEELKTEDYFYNKRSILEAVKHDFRLKSWVCNLLFPKCCEPSVVTFILKRQPLAIKTNKEAVVKTAVNKPFDEFRPFVRMARLYSSFGVPQALVEECRAVLTKDELDENYLSFSKPNAIQMMSLLMCPAEFFQVAQEFAPTSDKIGDYSEEVAALTKMQEAVATSIKYVYNPSDFIPLIRQFSKGDYLKYTVGTINSIALKIPEKIILPLLIEWLDCPVSLRKHFIRAYSAVAPLESTAQLLVNLFEREKNTSIRLVLFTRMFSLFALEPNEDMFKAFKSFLMTLTPEDDEVMSHLFDLKKVADQYVSHYLEMLWEVIGLKGDKLGSKGRDEIIDLIDNEILGLLSVTFCETLLTHIFSKQNLKNHGLFDFVCRYLLYNNETVQEKRLSLVVEHIKNVFPESWNEHTLLDYNVFPARKTMAHFVVTLCDKSFNLGKSQLNPLNLLTEFKAKLSAIIDSSHLVEEFIRLEFAIFYHKNNVGEVNRITPELVAQFLDASTHQLVTIHGPLVIDFIKEALPLHLLKTEDQIKVSVILLTQYSLETSHMLAVHLLPHVIDEDASVQHYKVIIASIMSSQFKSVQLLGSKLLKNMSSSVRVA